MKKHSRIFPRFSLAFSLGLAMMTSFPVDASIPETTINQGSAKPWENLLTLNRSGIGFKVRGIRPSRRREGGIVRKGSDSNTCAGQPLTVTALLPKTNEAQLLEKHQIEIESTVSARPTFFFHISSKPPVKEADFLVKNEKNEIVVDQKIALTDTAGILSISIPEDAKPLEAGKLYHWSFTVICDPVDNGGNMIVDGWVGRIKLDSSLSMQLEKASERERVALYAQAGIWTDALSTLANLRKAKPKDLEIEKDWESLLKSVNLSTVANDPFLD